MSDNDNSSKNYDELLHTKATSATTAEARRVETKSDQILSSYIYVCVIIYNSNNPKHIVSACSTPKCWTYNHVFIGESVTLENLASVK